ncbi:hypothetical protein JCM13664_19590 [Methylothermus subterraneus]
MYHCFSVAINVTRAIDPIVGFSGGLLRGTLDSLGRLATGVLDVLSSPIPTESLIDPKYVWQDFDRQTSYRLW